MKSSILLIPILIFLFATAGQAQFGIPKSINSKIKSESRKRALEEEEKARAEAEDKAMEKADNELDKAAEAAEPGLKKAEEAEKAAEEYAIYGVGQYNSFVEGYEEDVASKDPADYKKYPFETAIVEYKLEGNENGSKTMYIDMGGYKVAEYKTLIKKKSEEKTAFIMYGADIITIDFENEEAVKMHNPMAYFLANPSRNWEETGENLLIRMGYAKTGTESLQGKECDIWKHGKHSIWVWDGLTLKSQNGKDVETATLLEINTKMPQEVFTVPETFEYEIIEAEDLFPELSEEEAKKTFEDEEEMDELLDEIEKMSYSEYKDKVLEEDPNLSDQEIKQSYLYLRQEAKRRHR